MSHSLTRVALSQHLDSHLAKVSRTFALNIRVLPPLLREQVTVSYLFCRIADTIEDSPLLEGPVKSTLLNDFAALFNVPQWPTESIIKWMAQLPKNLTTNQNDLSLVQDTSLVFDLARDYSDPVKAALSHWIREMCTGMAFYATKANRQAQIPLISDIKDLDRYCYYVAGTVGYLLCDLFSLSSPFIGKKRKEKLSRLALSFGLGLQLTNILKDFASDQTRDTVFIPDQLLREYGLSSDTLTSDASTQKMHKLTQVLAHKTLDHLNDAMEYTCLLPRLEPRLRLFCLWPLSLAVESLALILDKPVQHAQGQVLKISRDQVKSIIKETSLTCWSNYLLRKNFAKRTCHLKILLNKDL